VRINHSRILLLLVMILIGVLTVSGCARTIGMARGWAGGTVADDTIFIASMQGKLIALNVADGSSRGDPVALETPPAAGGFGCLPSACAQQGATAVAIYGSPAVDGDLVYVGGYNDGKIRAFLFEEGSLRQEPRWVYPREGGVGGSIVGGLVVAHDRVYFGSANGTVYALDAADGFTEWDEPFQTGDKIWSTPAVDGDTLFIGSFDKKLYAVDTTTGNKKWEFETEGAIVSAPVVYNSTVYFGSFDRHIYAVNVVSGKELWRFPATDEEENKPSNWFWAQPLVHDGVVYAASLDGKVYALNAESGSKLAEFDLGNPISSSPVLVDNLIIVATQEGEVWALDTGTKQKRLLNNLEENVYAPLFASQGTVYVHTTNDNLYALDVKSGASKKFTLTTSE